MPQFEHRGSSLRGLTPPARLGLIHLICIALVVVASGCAGTSRAEPDPQDDVVQALRTGGGNGGTAAAATTPTGTGWGTLKGQFVLDGAPLPATFLPTGGKDGQVCDVMPIPDQSLVVDAQSKGIANIVVYARKVSRIHESAKEAAAAEVVFDQKNCVFLTHIMAVQAGQPVKIKNSDPIGHNTNVSPRGDAPINPLLPGGADTTYQFTRAQTEPVAVTCNIHPWMKAYIMPRKDPYCAVTDREGRFEIANLPAGEKIEFQVWQEKAGPLEAKSGWSKGRFTETILADDAKDLGTIAVPAAKFQ